MHSTKTNLRPIYSILIRAFTICVGLILLALPSASHASASRAPQRIEPLATVLNDRNKDVHRLSVMLAEDGTVSGLQFATDHEDGQHTTRNFTVAQIANGAVLDGDAEHAVIVLTGTIQGRGSERNLTLKFLNNQVSGIYKKCETSLVRQLQGEWVIRNASSRVIVKQIFIKTWSLGIETVVNICD